MNSTPRVMRIHFEFGMTLTFPGTEPKQDKQPVGFAKPAKDA